MKFSKQITVNASEEKVWNIMAREFANVGVWATPVYHSVANDKLPSVNNSPVGGRLCDTSLGTVSEEFTAYDDEKRTFSFKGVIGSKMFKSIINATEITSIDENTSVLKITPQLELSFLGVLMYPMIKKSLSRTIDVILDDLKYYAENGKPSPRKLASMEKK